MILSSFRWVAIGSLILEGLGSFGHAVEADAFKVSQKPPRPREYRLDSYNLSSSHDVRALCGVAQMGANQYGIAPNVTPEVLNGYDRALKQACVANRDEAKAQCSAPFDGVKGELACLPGTVTCFNPKKIGRAHV